MSTKNTTSTNRAIEFRKRQREAGKHRLSIWLDHDIVRRIDKAGVRSEVVTELVKTNLPE